MKSLFIAMVIILACSQISYAEWTKEKTAREIFFIAALVNDWHQTTVISRTPWRHEKNDILGKDPHQDNVHIYFSGCLIGHSVITYLLPDVYAKVWQDVWIGVESNVSDNNVKSGHTKIAGMSYKITHTFKF